MERKEPPQETFERQQASKPRPDTGGAVLRFMRWVFFIFVAAPFVSCVVTFEFGRTLFDVNQWLIFWLIWLLVVVFILARKILRALSGNSPSHKE